MKNRCILKKCAAILALIVSVAFSFVACGKEPKEPAVITMTTTVSKVWFTVAGTKDVAIDWGDGKKSNVKDATLDGISDWLYFTYDFSDATARNIVITGNVTMLTCRNIGLTALDVSRNIVLTDLNCSDNQLTGLDLSKNTALKRLEFDYNQIINLDVHKNTALTFLSCVVNQLTAAALNELFRTLPDNPKPESYESTIYITGNPGSLDCDRSIAEKKGWTFRTPR